MIGVGLGLSKLKLMGTGSSGEPHPGYTYLTTNGRSFWDLTRLTGADENAISNGNVGLEDLTASNHDLTIGNTPLINQITYNSQQVKGLKDIGVVYLNTNHNGSDWVTSSFEVVMLVDMEDGVPPETQTLLHLVASSQSNFYIEISNFGRIIVNYRSHSGSGGSFRWSADGGANALPNSPVQFYLRVRLDFELNTISVWRDGVVVSGTQISSVGLDVQDPTQWTSTQNFVIGNTNNSGTINQNNTTINTILRIAITPLMATQEAEDVEDYITTIF